MKWDIWTSRIPLPKQLFANRIYGGPHFQKKSEELMWWCTNGRSECRLFIGIGNHYNLSKYVCKLGIQSSGCNSVSQKLRSKCCVMVQRIVACCWDLHHKTFYDNLCQLFTISCLIKSCIVDLYSVTATGISPVIIHNCYWQVNLVNVFRRDIKDYGFIVNRIEGIPLGGRFPFL